MKEKREVSRRKFLQTAASAGVVAGMATVAMPIAAEPIAAEPSAANTDTKAKAGPAEGRSRPEDPLEKILSRYGSELGQVNRIR